MFPFSPLLLKKVPSTQQYISTLTPGNHLLGMEGFGSPDTVESMKNPWWTYFTDGMVRLSLQWQPDYLKGNRAWIRWTLHFRLFCFCCLCFKLKHIITALFLSRYISLKFFFFFFYIFPNLWLCCWTQAASPTLRSCLFIHFLLYIGWRKATDFRVAASWTFHARMLLSTSATWWCQRVKATAMCLGLWSWHVFSTTKFLQVAASRWFFDFTDLVEQHFAAASLLNLPKQILPSWETSVVILYVFNISSSKATIS